MAIRKQFITCLFFFSCLVVNNQGTADSSNLEQLLNMDIQELMDLPVLMPSRKLERQFDAPSAIYVITSEDIRRSGLTRIPELLRMVPGLSVGRLDNNTWSVSARSISSRFINSMLVLLDGRTLYNPLFGGVYWDVQDVYLDDVDRIEIIRGPGGSMWGANAVNGIINIITKPADKTKTTSIYAGVGKGETRYNAGFRIGDQINPDIVARAYFKSYETDQGEYLGADESTNAGFFNEGDDAYDNGRNNQAGFRLDWTLNPSSTLSVTGDTYDSAFNSIRTGLPHENKVKAQGSNIVSKWDKTLSGKSSISMQFYVDHTKRKGILFDEERKIYDLDFQHILTFASNELVWGLGYRYTSDNTERQPVGSFELDPASQSDSIVSAFIQDHISIVKNKVIFTFGAKFEENDYTGGEIQPTARIVWKKDSSHTLWGAVTRAVRVPSRSDLHAQLNFGGPPISIGNPDAQAESVVASEIGYRSRTNATTLIDVAVFNHNYSDPNTKATNLGRTYGLEAVINYEINRDWRTETSYTWHKGYSIVSGDKVENDNIANTILNVRSLFNINKNWEFDTFVSYKEAHESQTVFLEDYIRVDVRLGWSPYSQLRTSLTVSNLFDDKHAELADATRVNTTIGRSIYLALFYDW